MYLLLGLLCTNPGDLATCQTMQYGNPFNDLVLCEATGQAQLGTETPFGRVMEYTCEPVGEDA